jgi:alpha-glucosidase (family GH31 glycosyl hydrolase)
MRWALDLRYRLLPYHYSLAHAMFKTRTLWMRPLAMVFPDDDTGKSVTSEWMDGELLVAPVLRQDAQKRIYLPRGQWYSFNRSFTPVMGPLHIKGHATLEEVPVFIRAGGVVPLAPLVQYTDALPGGPLEVQVYAGASGSFNMVEDDGASIGYENGAIRTTTLSWSDDRRVFSWNTTGKLISKQAFKHLFVTLFSSSGKEHSAIEEIGESGSISFDPR